MKLIKEIAGRIFAFWALIVFSTTMLFFSIAVWATKFLEEPNRSIQAFKIFRIWLRFFFIFSGVKRVYKGKEYFKPGENYIVVCNHNSIMDPPLSSPGIPGTNKTIAKKEMAKIPIFGMIYKRGSVLVNRKNDQSKKESFAKMKNVLELGMHMCIYPEGTRNKGAEPLQWFHDGAFSLAKETGKPIIPALLFNTKKVLPNDKTFFFWPQKVEMHFLPPVYVTKDSTVESLKETVFNQMKAYYVANNH